MAKVGNRQFAYTPMGERQADAYAKKTGLKKEGGYGVKTVSTNKKGKVVIKTYG